MLKKQSIHSHLSALEATWVGTILNYLVNYYCSILVDSLSIHFFYAHLGAVRIIASQFPSGATKLLKSFDYEVSKSYITEVRIISKLMINEQIRDKEVRVIGTDGEQLGVMDTKEAKRLAEEAGVDLIKIAPTAKPPVCKIMDYGKYKYEQTRREKENKKKQKTIETKEVRLSPNIDTNDLNTKANMARKFLTKGDKVKVTLRFRGRELAHVDSSKAILDEFAELLQDVAVVDKPAKLEGRSMVMFLTEKR